MYQNILYTYTRGVEIVVILWSCWGWLFNWFLEEYNFVIYYRTIACDKRQPDNRQEMPRRELKGFILSRLLSKLLERDIVPLYTIFYFLRFFINENYVHSRRNFSTYSNN